MAEDKMVEKIEHQSKIVSLKIENFMSIKNGLIEFDENNIISLCGYNDSGKSAVTRLLEVMLYNSYVIDQVKFVTDEEDYWQGVLTFSDGVVYTRRKYKDGKSLWELSKGDKILFTNKLPNGTYAAMSDIPEVISKYLGVIQEELTGEELNVRRNTDKLFLINTSGGDNYKILNSVLRSDVLSSASKSLNDDKNKLKAEVDEKTTIKSVLQEQLETSDAAPQEEIDEVNKYISNLEEQSVRITSLSMIMDENKKKHSVFVFEELNPVDVSQIKDLRVIMEFFVQKNKSIYDSLTSVDIERIKELQNIMELSKKVKGSTYEELEPIDIERIKMLKNLGDFFTAYISAKKAYETTNSKLAETKNKLKMLSEQYNLKICKNCGSIVA